MKRTSTRLLALALIALSAATAATVHAQSLNARIDTRPLTPQEVTDYGLAGTTEIASGLNTVGRGQPVYLEALINSAINPSNIVSVVWNLVGQPGVSSVLETSPLGANVPVYKPAERSSLQVAGRTLLRPMTEGQYKVAVTITTTTTTASLTNTIMASTYAGAATCSLCHSGNSEGIPNTYVPWSETPHAGAFTRAINGVSTDHFNQNCISCHVVGFDKNTNAVNSGWDDIALSTGWQFPTNFSTNNFASMPAELRNVSNVQCENCHGAGNQHALTALLNPLAPQLARDSISVTFSVGDCSQCHDKLSHHYKTAEWNNSGHAVMGSHTSSSCARCHTAEGFANFVDGKPAVSVPYEVVGCSTCHDPHDAANPHQLRTVADVTLMDNITTVTSGGAGKVCMNCHISRRDATNYVETTSGSSGFGPHHGPQTDMLVGANAITYGKAIPSSAHRDSVTNSCVTCHMQDIESGPAFTHAGGHTFKLSYADGSNVVDVVDSCVQCHGNIASFDIKRQDFDGNGIIEGVQTEVKGLLNKLAYLLPPVGVEKSSLSINNTWTKQQLRAAYNYQFVLEDGSFGVHNSSYAVGLLKASIGDLNGDSNTDGVSDAWQTQYFGANFATNPQASPNAINNTNGVPNWMMATLNLNPSATFSVDGTGVLYVNGKNIVNGATDTVAIYTAAEVAFNTELGKTYQIQGISAFPGVWQNISTNIPGTGTSVSYVTPTRDNVQMFFRVIHTP